jgi:inorganic pyrophosphatase
MSSTPHYEQVPIGPNAPHEVRTIIEVPKGGSNKYKFNPPTDTFNYGWICGTRSPVDGKPLSCLVIAKNPTFPGCMIEARPIATLQMSDARGDDPKILCAAVCDPRLEGLQEIKDLSEHELTEVRHFFEIYQALEQHEVQIQGWLGTEATIELIRDAMNVVEAH